LGAEAQAAPNWAVAIATVALVTATLLFWAWTVRERKNSREPEPWFVRGRIRRDAGDDWPTYTAELLLANPGDVPILLTGILILIRLQREKRLLRSDAPRLSDASHDSTFQMPSIPPHGTAIVEFCLLGLPPGEKLEPDPPTEEGHETLRWQYFELGMQRVTAAGVRTAIVPGHIQWFSDSAEGLLTPPGALMQISPPSWLMKYRYRWILRVYAAAVGRTRLAVALWRVIHQERSWEKHGEGDHQEGAS